MPERSYDVIVIGAGPTGENVASRAARGGCRTVVVEAELVGGECSYWACIPSKALLRPAHALADARAVAGASQAVTGGLDPRAAFARRDGFTGRGDDSGQVSWLAEEGIDLVRGRGRLDGEKRVVVEGGDGPVALVATEAVVVATGTRASIPPVPGLEGARPWTSREATTAESVPGRLAVIGGGVVASEMACAYAQLGSTVTVIQRGPRLLTGVATFAAEAVAESMREMGVDLRLGAEADRVTRRDDGTVELVVGDGTVVADEVLVAAGRAPNTGSLGLATVGLEPGGWLEVDDHLGVTGVTGGWLYAAGDVNHRALLTHMGKYQARVCGDVIAARAAAGARAGTDADAGAGGVADPRWGEWGRLRATADHRAVPQVIFTLPEVAAVGLSGEQARDRGLDVVVASYDIGSVAGASLYADGYQGRAEVVVERAGRTVVGMTLVGPAVGELIHAGTVAIVGQVPVERLWHAVPSFPTISEVWLRLLEALDL